MPTSTHVSTIKYVLCYSLTLQRKSTFCSGIYCEYLVYSSRDKKLVTCAMFNRLMCSLVDLECVLVIGQQGSNYTKQLTTEATKATKASIPLSLIM